MPSHVRQADEVRVLNAIDQLGRYGALAMQKCAPLRSAVRGRKPVTLDIVGAYLESLALVLDDATVDEEATENELGELKAEIKCAGRFALRVIEAMELARGNKE